MEPVESTFAGIAEISSDAVITIDASHTITFFNRGAADIFGWAAEEVVGRPLDILLPERFRAIHPDRRRRAPTARPSAPGLRGEHPPRKQVGSVRCK